MGVLDDHDCDSTLFWLTFGREAMSWVWKGFFEAPGGVLWVCSGAWCEKGVTRRLCKNAIKVCGEMKERACVRFFKVVLGARWIHQIPDQIVTHNQGMVKKWCRGLWQLVIIIIISKFSYIYQATVLCRIRAMWYVWLFILHILCTFVAATDQWFHLGLVKQTRDHSS